MCDARRVEHDTSHAAPAPVSHPIADTTATAGPPQAPAPAPPNSDLDGWVHHDPEGLHGILRGATGWYWHHAFRLRTIGTENVPGTGAVLLVPNHSSYADPFLQARDLSRPVRFMTKSTLFEVPLLGGLVRRGGGFPVRRGQGDIGALEMTRRMLEHGQAVFVYPEGTRFRTGLALGPPKRGVARLALETGVPVVPIATWGAKERSLYGRGRGQRPMVTTVYGEPMHLGGPDPEPSRERVDEVRDAIWEQVQTLYERARRDVEERSAGRMRRARQSS